MRNKRPRNFRHRSNGRNFRRRLNDNGKGLSLGSFNDRPKNNFKSNQSAEKLLERYKILAKEALSSGDRILSENYLQHVDHFMRIISLKSINQNGSASKPETTIKEINNNSLEKNDTNQNFQDKNKE